MKGRTAVLVCILAIIAFIAEYYYLGIKGYYIYGPQQEYGWPIIFHIWYLTASIAILSPISAVIRLISKKKNLGLIVFFCGIMLVAMGWPYLIGILVSIYYH